MSEATTERQITYFDISIAGVPAGRVVFQLYNDLVPKTAENFRPFLTLHPPAARLLSFPDRRTLHWRKGRRKIWKAPMVQRQWLSSCHQEVRTALPHLIMAWTLTAARTFCSLYPQIHDPGWRLHRWKWSVLCHLFDRGVSLHT